MTVIGAGAMGRRLAALSCRAGCVTVLEDVLPSNLRTARVELAGQHTLLRTATSVAEGVRDADLVLDSVPDELESKLEIFSMVDRMAPPRTLLMTPTDTQSIADLAACTYRGERCFSFVLPEEAHQDGARQDEAQQYGAQQEQERQVQVWTTQQTSPELIDAVEAFWARAGCTAVFSVDPAHLQSPYIR